MKHYIVEVVDGYTSRTITLHFWGQLSSISSNGKEYKTIVNEYDTAIFIAGSSTISIKEFEVEIVPNPNINHYFN